MNSKIDNQKIIAVVIALLCFLAFTFGYFSPLLSGKVLSMHDINMASGAAQEVKEFHDKTGEWPWWTNSMFGGMPAFMILGGYDFSLTSYIGSFLYNVLPNPANVFLLLMCVFYFLMRTLKIENLVSILSSIAFAFGTYNLVFTEAGHISKIMALAFLPGILAGLIYVFRGKYLLGILVTTVFLGLEIHANHLQVTYYFLFILTVYVLYSVSDILKRKEYKKLNKVLLSFCSILILGVGMNVQRLWSTLEYTKETTRGVSELTREKDNSKGLTKDYAFSWSYGIAETLNLMVPNLMGGSSIGSLDEDSETYRVLTSKGVDRTNALAFVSNLPLYHGDQSSTAGPAYSGIIVIFLFILGLFILPGKWKWFHLGTVFLLIFMSWGSNLPSLNYFLFDYFPGYNKFRAVSMILILVHFMLVWGAGVTLNNLIKEKLDPSKIKMPLVYSLAIVFGLCLIGYLGVDYISLRDDSLLQSLSPSLGQDFAGQVIASLRDDRASMALSDIIRGLFLILITILFVFLFISSRIKPIVFSILILTLCSFDLISVGKRYFNNDDFQSKFKVNSQTFEPTAADQTILQDDELNFRVLNLASPSGFMSDARDSYYHKSLGGYHGSKLMKYNELVENEMIKDGRLNMGVINMLNTKYLIQNSENGLVANLNTGRLGNAWFVDSLLVVENANEELQKTGSMDLSKTAVVVDEFLSESKSYSTDSNSTVELITYEPNRLSYKTQSSENGFVVFSEIFYRGNKDWKSYIDGREVSHYRVNYVLRGLEVPSGEHEVVFEFKPNSIAKGKFVDLISSVLTVVLFGVILVGVIKK
ncbi:YfhO family protein [Jiulongibacter sp. NS-SX5]|uniref:YfhO family protein n=1 Tax=Jiulongibacter sp. NS-SX5 TaxID=3463854 RepID=UPI004059239C